jgi:hypothetical protein
MSYQEKRTLVTIIIGFFVLVIYCVYGYSNYRNGVILIDDLSSWAKLMLIFIGIGVLATIITQIMFHIIYSVAIAIREKATHPDISDKDLEKIIKQTMITDEMDKLVELKSMRVGFIIAGTGFILSLFFILFGFSATVMIHTAFISFSFGSMCEGLMQIFYYRRGIQHG